MENLDSYTSTHVVLHYTICIRSIYINIGMCLINIHKNLVSGSLLRKNEFKMVFKSNKFVLTKNEVYVDKKYLANGLFKMNVMTILRDFNNNKANSFAYLLESFNLWHDKLGHMDFNSLCKLRHLNHCLTITLILIISMRHV